jgi:ABC-2 type transport system ATP-binding protein
MLGFLPGDNDASATIFGRASEDLEVRAVLGYQGDSVYRARNVSVRSFLAYHAELSGSALPGQIDAYLAEFNMTPAAGRSLHSLSKGMRQKIELILAFLGSPQIVFLDEPTASLDPPSVFELREFLLVQKKKGVTVFFSSHNLTEVEQVCSRVLFISDGSIIAEYDMTKRRAKGFLEKAFKKHLIERQVVA